MRLPPFDGFDLNQRIQLPNNVKQQHQILANFDVGSENRKVGGITPFTEVNNIVRF